MSAGEIVVGKTHDGTLYINNGSGSTSGFESFTAMVDELYRRFKVGEDTDKNNVGRTEGERITLLEKNLLALATEIGKLKKCEERRTHKDEQEYAEQLRKLGLIKQY